MRSISKNAILAMHDMLAKETGGDPSLRDTGLLESALAAPFAAFGGVELYPTAAEKAARLGFALMKNHPFADGNKRIGMLALLTFLTLNGSPLQTSSSEVSRVGFAVASGEMGYEALLSWVLSGLRPHPHKTFL